MQFKIDSLIFKESLSLRIGVVAYNINNTQQLEEIARLLHTKQEAIKQKIKSQEITERPPYSFLMPSI